MVTCSRCKYSTRDLTSKVQIERLTTADDGYGGRTETWTADPTGGVFAKWKALSGRESYQGMREGGYVTVRLVIRFRGDTYGAPYYTSADRVTHRNREYGIEAVRDPDDRRRWLELDLVETQAS